MMRAPLLIAVLVAMTCAESGRAVEQTDGTYNTNDPTAANIPHWTTGWSQPATEPAGYTYTTGWNYVGTVGTNNASGTYLGNGWVLTAAHVGAGTFTLDGVEYSVIANSARQLGSADLTVFKIASSPALPNLTLSSSDPSAYNTTTQSGGSNVAIIGDGDGGSRTTETWGYNTVTNINQPITPQGTSYVSNDFLTATTTSYGLSNSSQVVVGDSGGGDFIYNSATGHWELAGINEVTGSYENDPTYGNDNLSGFVQIDTYAAEIDAITGVPEPSPGWLLGMGLGVLWIGQRGWQKRVTRGAGIALGGTFAPLAQAG